MPATPQDKLARRTAELKAVRAQRDAARRELVILKRDESKRLRIARETARSEGWIAGSRASFAKIYQVTDGALAPYISQCLMAVRRGPNITVPQSLLDRAAELQVRLKRAYKGSPEGVPQR